MSSVKQAREHLRTSVDPNGNIFEATGETLVA
jgi:hypothetical protein